MPAPADSLSTGRSDDLSSAMRVHPTHVQKLIQALGLEKHPAGGYYAAKDRSPIRVISPIHTQPPEDAHPIYRSLYSSIYYLLTTQSPKGCFHYNLGTTIHSLHSGRGKYVVIHKDEDDDEHGNKRVETFVVGQNVEAGEKIQWAVAGGNWKASWLLMPDAEHDEDAGGNSYSSELLISEVVVPGWEVEDHGVLTHEGLNELVKPEMVKKLDWLIAEANGG